jgi:hypothetical protein
MPNQNTTESGQLRGGICIAWMGTPRWLISLKMHNCISEVIIRYFHLLDYSYGFNTIEGDWIKRGDFSSSLWITTFPILERFEWGPLEFPMMRWPYYASCFITWVLSVTCTGQRCKESAGLWVSLALPIAILAAINLNVALKNRRLILN